MLSKSNQMQANRSKLNQNEHDTVTDTVTVNDKIKYTPNPKGELCVFFFSQ